MRCQKKQRKRKISILAILILLICAGILCKKSIFSIRHYANTSNGWNLILVNKHNYIPRDYAIKLTKLYNGEKVDVRIYPGLQEMFNAARADGVKLHVSAGYRTKKKQQELMDKKIEAFKKEGYSKKKAIKFAKKWVAEPGTSEHQIGIAVDINADRYAASSYLFSWLKKNSYKYGFIQRYPPEKDSITGISYEPWHYRYVGKKAAEDIYKKGLCLEEYIQMIN